MTTVYPIGNAMATKQATRWLLGGTWEATDILTATINSRAVSIIVGSTSITTILATLVAALEASTDPEFTAIEWTADGNYLVAEGKLGVPFVCTLSTTETGGGAADAQTIDGSASSTGTNDTDATGSEDWNNESCWNSAVPVDTDDLLIANYSSNFLWGLNQASIALNSARIMASMVGRIGQKKFGSAATTPTFKTDSTRFLRIDCPSWRIGDGEGSGSPYLLIDMGALDTVLICNRTGTPDTDDIYALQILGTGTNNAFTINRGIVGIAPDIGQAATIDVLKVWQFTSPTDSKVFCGSGVTLNEVQTTGGQLILNCAATEIVMHGGQVTCEGGNLAYGLIEVNQGLCIYKTSGTMTQVTLSQNGTIDFSQDLQARTITDIDVYPGSVLSDPFGTLTFTNPVQFHCTLDECVFKTISPFEAEFVF